MGLITQYSRIKHHTVTNGGFTASQPFTVPYTEDYITGIWSPNDLALSEIGINEQKAQAWVRIGPEVYRFLLDGEDGSRTVALANTSGTQSVLLTDFGTQPDTLSWFEVRTTAISNPTASNALYDTLHFAVLNTGGTASILNSVDQVQKTNMTVADITVSVGGPTVSLFVHGEPLLDLQWKSNIFYNI